tara:strand:- start:195 stop:311 length:117 start_codon:yes stop_codon:yes gene_type:complete
MSGFIVTEFLLKSQYILIIQDSEGEVLEIAQTDFKEYE